MYTTIIRLDIINKVDERTFYDISFIYYVGGYLIMINKWNEIYFSFHNCIRIITHIY